MFLFWILREADFKNDNKEFHIIFVPRKSHLCDKKLKEYGVYGSFKENLREYFLDLIPLDYDILSMENPEFYKVKLFCFFSIYSLLYLHDSFDNNQKDAFLYNDTTYLYHIAKSLMTIQALYGIIPNIYGKGKMSKVTELRIYLILK
jgi:hypothetical protein